jgi:hypothetical protein
MKANGEDIKTIQKLLRHANYKGPPTFTRRRRPKQSARLKLGSSGCFAGNGYQKGELNRAFLTYRTLGRKGQFNNFFRMLASPTGFEPVLPP